jgi:acyl carrier protein
MTTAEFYKELDSTLNLAPGTIKGDESLLDLSGWDSMALLMFIYMADSKLGLAVKASALVNCKTVGDLVKVCEGKVQD